MTEPAVAVGTVAARNFLPHARVLARSLAEHHPDVPMYLLLVDGANAEAGPSQEPFTQLALGDLPLDAERRRRFLFRYERKCATAAAKPLLLEALLDRGHERAVYLDADVLVLGPLDALLRAPPAADVVLCPHRLSPRADGASRETDLRFVLAGTFNGGVLAVRASETGRAFLDWFRSRLELHCIADPGRGLHRDQGWLDLVPGMFDGVQVLRDPSYDVAYWNLDERSREGVRLFHFSGFDPERPGASIYAPELTAAEQGPFADLYERYRTLLTDAGHGDAAGVPYAFDRFDDGRRIPEIAREIYAAMGEDAAAFGDPFATGAATSFRRWLAAPVDGGFPPVARLWLEIYARRPDVRFAFPDPLGADRAAFVAWAATSAAHEHALDSFPP